MARWLVNRRDRQFSVGGLSDLVQLVQSGKLVAGDLIQPPGANDWLYAVEIDGLKDALARAPKAVVDEDEFPAAQGTSALTYVLAGVLGVVAIGGAFAAVQYYGQLPDPQRRLADQVGFSEMVVTGGGTQLLSEAGATAAPVKALEDGAVLELLAKRGELYKARDASGAEGWVRVDNVMPMYLLGGGDVIKERDPLYNPDRYVFVQNASWMQLPEQQEEQLTVFQFRLQNESVYDMTDLVMVARIKDSKGQELEKVEFRIEGIVPAEGGTMVGTLTDPTTEARRLVTASTVELQAKDNPDLQLQYTDGVEVKMQTVDFTEASIDIVELRAVPKAG